jgi:pimeloyl-ACP methyl ester carboxylesterase
VADITQLLAFHDLRDVTLVGHSYGGVIITGAASRRPDLVRHLVYLDAFVPTGPGQAANHMAPPERRAAMEAWMAEHECQCRSKIPQKCRSKIPQKCRSNFPHFRDLVTSQIRGLS